MARAVTFRGVQSIRPKYHASEVPIMMPGSAEKLVAGQTSDVQRIKAELAKDGLFSGWQDRRKINDLSPFIFPFEQVRERIRGSYYRTRQRPAQGSLSKKR